MKFAAAAAWAAAAVTAIPIGAAAQVGNPASPLVGTPAERQPIGPPAPARAASAARIGPLPPSLTLPQALEEAAARSPEVIAAEEDVRAAEARARQAGFRPNPELSFEVENFAGTGELKGMRSTETTLAVNHRLDWGGRRPARIEAARTEIELQRLQLAISRADLAQNVRQAFARAVAAGEKMAQADETVERARELARVAGILVEAGRDPPLRALRARSALAQALAEQEAARAEELASRTTLASLLGSGTPVGSVAGPSIDLKPSPVNLDRSLEVRLADAQIAAAEAMLRVQLAERRIDPAVGIGVRHVRETGDVGLVAGASMPLRLFDRNQGNVAAARSAVAAARARRAGTVASVTARGRNAIATVEAAERRVAALERAAVPEAAEALRLTQIAYGEGRASLLELIDAQDAYASARTSLTEARLALALATAELGRIAARQEQP